MMFKNRGLGKILGPTREEMIRTLQEIALYS
jgi:hypothetical protein